VKLRILVQNRTEIRLLVVAEMLYNIIQCLLNSFGNYLVSSDLQIGFKKKLGRGHGVYLLQNLTILSVERVLCIWPYSMPVKR